MMGMGLPGCALLVLATLGTVALPAGAMALEEKKDEKDKLKACERRICDAIVKKAPATGDVSCALTKTWARKSIKESSEDESKKVDWTFGDARCTVDLKVPRSLIVSALSDPGVKLELPLHRVDCEIERDKEVDRVHFTLGPKVRFENGVAKQVWINLKKVEGPGAIKAMATSLAKLEDTVGLFQGPLTKAINKFIAEKCPKAAKGG
jgi:hypothetical protein